LTDGEDDDFDPAWLPDGRIAFISTRRGGYGRCHGGRIVPTYTLHSIGANGTGLRRLSHHETNEWNPSVDNDGRIVYTRWDYVDRDSDIAHHLWVCGPDGSDPRSFHGNYPLPWSTIGELWKRGYPAPVASRWGPYDEVDPAARRATGLLDGRCMRPWGEWHLRPIPGSRKYVGIASAHHGTHVGTVIVIDHDVEDDNVQSQLRRLTPHFFPESETSRARQTVGAALNRYAARPVDPADLHFRSAGMAHPWALSEDFFLVARGGGIELRDRFGNALELCKGSRAIPLEARPRPAATTPRTFDTPAGPSTATISVMNVYDADLPWPKGVRIQGLRIIQVLPQSAVPGSAPLVRMPLGVVPVEEDGSVYCEAPIGREIYFQALDEYGMAVQSMRSGTFLHRGEHLSCQGCHERKWQAPAAPKAVPLALRRAPSRIEPEVATGAVPFNARLLLGDVSKKCDTCHKEKNVRNGGLKGQRFQFSTTGNGAIMGAARGGSRTIPGSFGARATRIGPAFRKKVHQEGLTREEMRRVTLWLDCNSMNHGVYTSAGIQAQNQGEVVWPLLDVDPDNPLGLQRKQEDRHASRAAPPGR
ncbi:MAG TPA: hypothetical protein VM695_11280, partial [Phycisphaerae bacterium]|nr:hypothetical protein [Phycisphaerae bacterium]